MVDYEETRENAILSLEQQIKQLVKDAFDKGYQCGYKDRRDEPKRGLRRGGADDTEKERTSDEYYSW